MTAPVIPIQAYRWRASNRPKPPDHQASVVAWTVEHGAIPSHPTRFHATRAQRLTGTCYFADVSEFQVPYNDSYPYEIAFWRGHTGYRLDNHAKINWSFHEPRLKTGLTRIAGMYMVFVPGQLAVMQKDIINAFGKTTPSDRLVMEIDMESGNGFAGPGNHSAEAGEWLQWLADWTGTARTVALDEGYANNPDWAECWPTRPGAMKRRIADYSSVIPSDGFSVQYYGGMTQYPSPAGAPRACAPFGTYVDLNLVQMTIDEVEAAYGIVDPAPPPPPSPEEDFMFATSILYAISTKDAPAGTAEVGEWVYWPASNAYFHIAGAANGIDNVKSLTGPQVGGITGGPLTYAQHLGIVAQSSNATSLEKDRAIDLLAALPVLTGGTE